MILSVNNKVTLQKNNPNLAHSPASSALLSIMAHLNNLSLGMMQEAKGFKRDVCAIKHKQSEYNFAVPILL